MDPTDPTDHVSVNNAMAAAEAGGQTERLKQLTVGVGATGVSGVGAGGNSDGGEDDDGDVEREDGEREGGDGAGLIDGCACRSRRLPPGRGTEHLGSPEG